MMLLLLLLQSVTPGVLPKQDLPATGCAAYLWSVADRNLIAMASADPARLRVAVDGKIVDVARIDESGAADFGFADVTNYAASDLTVTLAMTIQRKTDLAAGAAVPAGTLTITRSGVLAGHDSVIVPVAGLVGCAS